MGELTIFTLCQTLSNLTYNRCSLIENTNTCRCTGDIIHPIPSTISRNTTPDMMLSEVFLIFLVLIIWLSAIGFCLNQYKSLRRLETQVHYCVNRKDPLNIGDIKIVTREQDSIIYKKKRYSTLLDTQINTQDLKTMHYVQQYLPKPISSTISAIVINRDDLSTGITTRLDSSNNNQLSTHHEVPEYQSTMPYFKTDMESIKRNTKLSHIQRIGSARYSPGLTVPHMSPSTSSQSAWNEGQSFTQHLDVPSNSLSSNSYSAGNVSLPVPYENIQPSDEQLLDPRLISATVRRSLLALHRQSQENINVLKKKHQTQSENDVHGALTSLKIKMKSKRKYFQQQFRPHSNTLSILSQRTNSNDSDSHISESINITQQKNQILTTSTMPSVRRSFEHYSISLTESETEHVDTPLLTDIIHLSTNNDELNKNN